jgi:hypothetical protein
MRNQRFAALVQPSLSSVTRFRDCRIADLQMSNQRQLSPMMNNDTFGLDELCDGIRKNDPSIRKVHIPVSNQSQVDSLLNALDGNTSVTSLVLDVDRIRAVDVSSFAPLLQYLKQCTSIQSVEILDSRDSIFFCQTGQSLQAMAENSTMELVEFQSRIQVCSRDLTALLEAKVHCLKQLHMERSFVRDSAEFDSSMLHLVQAIGSLRVLESCHALLPAEYTTLMLQKMTAHPCLRKLSVADTHTSPVTAGALSALLQSDVRLEALELASVRLDKEKMEYLIQGLLSCPTLADFTVRNCYFVSDDDDREDLADAFGTHLRKCRSIHQLHLIDCYHSERIASSALTLTESGSTEASACMGSSLRVLELKGVLTDIERVLKPLCTKESQLVELTLHGLTAPTWSQLTPCLSELCRVRELKLVFLNYSHWDFDSPSWLWALRQNGSLHDISVSYKDSAHAPILVGLDPSQMQSLCDRNRWAPGLLQEAGSDKDDLEKSPTTLSLIPSLCKTLAQSPRLAPTFLLSGMLAASNNDAIGLVASKKRVRCPDA